MRRQQISSREWRAGHRTHPARRSHRTPACAFHRSTSNVTPCPRQCARPSMDRPHPSSGSKPVRADHTVVLVPEGDPLDNDGDRVRIATGTRGRRPSPAPGRSRKTPSPGISARGAAPSFLVGAASAAAAAGSRMSPRGSPVSGKSPQIALATAPAAGPTSPALFPAAAASGGKRVASPATREVRDIYRKAAQPSVAGKRRSPAADGGVVGRQGGWGAGAAAAATSRGGGAAAAAAGAGAASRRTAKQSLGKAAVHVRGHPALASGSLGLAYRAAPGPRVRAGSSAAAAAAPRADPPAKVSPEQVPVLAMRSSSSVSSGCVSAQCGACPSVMTDEHRAPTHCTTFPQAS